MDPSSGISGFHRIKGGLVEAELGRSALAAKVQLCVLPPLPLLDRAFDRQRQLDHQGRHVRLDLVQMLLAKVLHGVSHGVRLKDGHTLKK